MKRIFGLLTLFLLFFVAHPVAAASFDQCKTSGNTSIICTLLENPELQCMKTGSCGSLDSILQVFATFATWLLGIAGSVMLLMFTWGGAEWVISRGESGMVKSGKSKMTSAIIGIVIMFGALAMVRSIRVGLSGTGTEPNDIAQCVVDQDCKGGGECFGGKCVVAGTRKSKESVVGGCSATADCSKQGTHYGCYKPDGAQLTASAPDAAKAGQCLVNCVGKHAGKGVCQTGATTCTNGLQVDGSPTGVANLCGTGFVGVCCFK
ncbi:MAG: pilin [Verrucomicrobiota bacterium]